MALDWTKKAAYAYCDQLSAAGWAFEFLRRNPEYRQDHAAVQALEATLTQDHGPYAQAVRAWRQDPRAWVYVPPRQPDESLSHWRNRASLSAGSRMVEEWYETWYSARWKLQGPLPDPGQPAIPPPEFVPLAARWPLFPTWGEVGEFYRDGPDERDGADWWPSAGHVVAVFDLAAPIPDQIGVLKEYLNEQLSVAKGEGSVVPLKVKKPGNTVALFRTYLRALDAHDAGVAEAEIGKVLFPPAPADAPLDFNTKKACDTLKQARNYTQRYRSVAFMAIDSD